MLHFFENRLSGEKLPDSLSNLINLRHLSIFNGEREFEFKLNYNANNITSLNGDYINRVLSKLVYLEEINMQWLNMNGDILSSTFF